MESDPQTSLLANQVVRSLTYYDSVFKHLLTLYIDITFLDTFSFQNVKLVAIFSVPQTRRKINVSIKQTELKNR